MSEPTKKPLNSESISTRSANISIVIFCGFLMGLSGFSTDVMLPAFTTMVVELNTSLDRVQATVASFAFFFGLGQIFYGPASDKYGRRSIISVGMVVFIFGSLLATYGKSIETVLIGRGLQGFGAGAAPVLARAILRDTHNGTALARAMAISMAIFAFGPIFAPLIGVAIVDLFGWRSTFASMGLLAFGLLAFNIFRFKETNGSPNPDALAPNVLWQGIKRFLSNRQSLYFLLCGCAAYCALFSYIANAPRIYAMAFEITGLEFSILFALTGLGIILGQVVNRALLPKLGVLNVLRIASLILFLAAVLIALLATVKQLNATWFTALMFCFNTSFLVIISNTATLCLDPHPNIAGLASATYGCVTNLTGAVFITLSVTWVGAATINWAIAMTALTLLAALGIWAVRKNRVSF